MRIIKYSGDNDGNGPSGGVWHSCPWAELVADPDAGYTFWDDFLDLPTGKYTATQASAGTFALDDAVGGVALADCNSGTVTQGINVQLGAAAGECFIPAAGKDLWFEARVKVADVATGPEFFLGLHEIDTTVVGSSALSGSNMIGWGSVTDDNILLFSAEKATDVVDKAATTMVEGTWVKLGFYVNGVTSISQYIDGVKTGTDHVTANVPIVAMVPTLVCQSNGTTDPIAHIDWWRCAQLR